jgi:hypothetical protein
MSSTSRSLSLSADTRESPIGPLDFARSIRGAEASVPHGHHFQKGHASVRAKCKRETAHA